MLKEMFLAFLQLDTPFAVNFKILILKNLENFYHEKFEM